MKKIFLLIALIGFIVISSFAQAPKGFKFQAVARDKDGNILSEKTVQLRISIIRGSEIGEVVYSETHKVTSNTIGLINLQIGDGMVEKGDFKTIEWGSASHYVKLEMDENGGSEFADMGTTELLSVPYAMYADQAGNQNKGVEWTVNGSSIYSNYSKVGIGTTTPNAALEITGTSYVSGPTVYGTQIAQGNIELTRSSSPYIDFNVGNDGSDYDGRIMYNSNGDYFSVVSAGWRIYSGQQLYVQSQSGFGIETPASSAKVDITSTTQGFLPPRMTTAQRNAISSPATGLQVFNTESNCLNFYTPNGWFEVCGQALVPTSPCGGVSSVEYYGKVYTTVAIGTQCWLGQNLNTTKYRNGDTIPNVTGNTAWGNLTTGAYCNYDNDANNATTYGRLYNWFAVNDSRNLCPTGWHVHTNAERTTLTDFLGGLNVAGEKLKETGTSHWGSPNYATNESNFTALPNGFRSWQGTYAGIFSTGFYWTSTENGTSAYYWFLGNNLYEVVVSSWTKVQGCSVRCIKD